MGSISIEAVKEIVSHYYGLDATITTLPGDTAFNYKIDTHKGERFLLKITGTETSPAFLEFQQSLHRYLENHPPEFKFNQLVANRKGTTLSQNILEKKGYHAQLFSWVEGRLWAEVNPKTPELRVQLGRMAGACVLALKDFQHPQAHRSFPWNLAESDWTRDHLHLFDSDRQELIRSYLDRFADLQDLYRSLPQAVVHNDLNDHNIIVSEISEKPKVLGLIDFGDAVYTQVINDAAIVIAYAMMQLPDPLAAGIDVLQGYSEHYQFSENEISCLHTLIAMRLITTVTQATLRKEDADSTEYHNVSEQDAWELLMKWRTVSEEFATYCFRQVVGFDAHPQEKNFTEWAKTQTVSFEELFPNAVPTINAKKENTLASCFLLNLKVSSKWMGSRHEFNDLDLFEYKIDQLQKEYPTKFIADGYLEPRPIYTSNSYDKEGNEGPESRSVHLGVDFWLSAHTSVHSLYDGEVITAVNDAGYKEYGGLIILKHQEDDITFYTLYGHLTAESPTLFKVGDKIKKGDRIGALGTPEENGVWAPHLHFQIMLSMLDYKIDFPG
ncbi:MAG: phosphotransferase, partial [Flavobacteriaceae bacterium]|nr:phosphotransferase [Flavobacteriaceae bacterium]